MRRLLSLIVALGMLTAGQAVASVALTRVVRTDHFLVHHEPSMESTAEVLADDSETWLREISGRLNARSYLQPPVPMFIYRDQGDFRKATGRPRAGMVLGRASSLGYVELDASGVLASAQQIAGHEITHVLIFRILGPRVDSLPLWANEGTAKYMTDDWSRIDQDNLTESLIGGSIMPLKSISRTFPSGQMESLAYAEGASAIRFFVSKYGERGLAELIHETGRTGSFEQAMRRVTGRSVAQFEKDWRASIEGGFGFVKVMRIARIISTFGWPLLIVLAYLAFRRRRRRMIQRYQQDEWEEANWRDWGGGR